MIEKIYYNIFFINRAEYLKDKDGRVFQFLNKEKAKEESKKYKETKVCYSGLLNNSVIIA
jgi:hypothetical protein